MLARQSNEVDLPPLFVIVVAIVVAIMVLRIVGRAKQL